MSDKQYHSGYEDLFDYLSHNHGLNMLQSEMSDLIHFVHKFHPHPQGAVWVKASMRLPEYGKAIFIKFAGLRLIGTLYDEAKIGDEQKNCLYFSGEDHFEDQFHLIEWLDESATTSSNWVNAEIKPEYNKGVLVFIPGEDNHITSGMWDISNKWVLLDEYRTPEEEVTHWMELPSLPNGYTDNELPKEIIVALKEIAKKELPKMKEQEIEWINESATTSNKDETVAFGKWLKHLDNGTEHFNPFTEERTDSIGFSPFDCFTDNLKTVEQLYDLWQQSKNNISSFR